MKCSRTTNKTHWKHVGSAAARMSLDLGKVLTGKAQIDAWIKEGFEKAKEAQK